MRNFKYLILGILFGIILVKSEVISWFRIQEMFRLQAFHMYGIIGSAIVVGMISILTIKRFQLKTIKGEAIIIPKKEFHWGTVYGGLIFGLGWANNRRMSRPLIRADRQRLSGSVRYPVKRHCRHLGLWFAAR